MEHPQLLVDGNARHVYSCPWLIGSQPGLCELRVQVGLPHLCVLRQIYVVALQRSRVWVQGFQKQLPHRLTCMSSGLKRLKWEEYESLLADTRGRALSKSEAKHAAGFILFPTLEHGPPLGSSLAPEGRVQLTSMSMV